MTEHAAPTVAEKTGPTPALYVKIAIVLAVMTGFEVSLYYIDLALRLGWIVAVLLSVLALLKFVIVIGWFMHLKYEKSTLSGLFSAGFSLAIAVYVVVLGAFGVIVATR